MSQLRARRGVILILVVGVCAMLASLALTFILRARMDAAEMQGLLRIAQCRLMLSAASAYVLESGRIGWDLRDDTGGSATPWATLYHAAMIAPVPGEDGLIAPDPDNARHREECFGWVDVRDGSVGPRTLDYDGLVDGDFDGRQPPAVDPPGGTPADTDDDETSRYDRRYDARPVIPLVLGGPAVRPAWPAIGAVSRHPMMAMMRPPFAITPQVTPNPINQDPAAWDFGLPLLRNPDGGPALSAAAQASTNTDLRWADWRAGDRRIKAEGDTQAWFRLLRDGPATFIVTTGCGGSLGYKSWEEVEIDGATARFAGDEAFFNSLRADEVRLWYRIEWSPAVSVDLIPFAPANRPVVSTKMARWASYVNQAGTISLIQRLLMEPVDW